jgi:hypothetical protein
VDPASISHAAAELHVDVDRPVGYAAARQNPLGGFAMGARIRWNSLIDGLCDRFVALCAAHNAGHISVLEFEARQDELNRATAAVCAVRSSFLQALQDYEAAQALVAPGVTPGERPPGATPAFAHSLMDDSRARATMALQAASAAVKRLDVTGAPVADAQATPQG